MAGSCCTCSPGSKFELGWDSGHASSFLYHTTFCSPRFMCTSYFPLGGGTINPMGMTWELNPEKNLPECWVWTTYL